MFALDFYRFLCVDRFILIIMKRGLLLFVFLCAVVSMWAQKEISYIETTKNWYYIYDESGKKIKTLYRSGIGDIKGLEVVFSFLSEGCSHTLGCLFWIFIGICVLIVLFL